MFNPCVEHCYVRYGKQYSPECDNECVYAKATRKIEELESESDRLKFGLSGVMYFVNKLANASPYDVWSDSCGNVAISRAKQAWEVFQRLDAERDALMYWAKGRCDTCAHKDDCVKHDPDPEGYVMRWYDDCEIWEWSGMQKEDKHEQ